MCGSHGPIRRVCSTSRPSLFTIGSAGVGDIVTSVGFGVAGTPSSGVLGDGARRGYNGRVNNSAFAYSSTYYQATIFGYSNSGVELNGRGTPGDSGSPVFNSAGDLIGLTKGATVAYDSFGYTSYLNLSQPEVLSWIQHNTVVPEPNCLLLVGIGGVGFVLRRNRTRNDRNG